ncbi:MAG TPA: L-threonylcarbamoyladenylate synthase [Methanomicrobiales archaeon]|nr:L-threonylcarbamoyladenylate synthase [Methanomicrobiales archaeon]
MDIVERAVQVLRRDGIIVYPTDTVYGLGGDAFSDDAIDRVFEAKGRPPGKPVSVAVSDPEMLCAIAFADDRALDFIGRFLPGPVTVILGARSCIPDLLTGGTGRIGIRMPANDLALRIITGFDAPITATSANVSGGAAPVSPGEVRVPRDLLVDGGILPGTPSTVVDLDGGTILRPGALAGEVVAWLRVRGGGPS